MVYNSLLWLDNEIQTNCERAQTLSLDMTPIICKLRYAATIIIQNKIDGRLYDNAHMGQEMVKSSGKANGNQKTGQIIIPYGVYRYKCS